MYPWDRLLTREFLVLNAGGFSFFPPGGMGPSSSPAVSARLLLRPCWSPFWVVGCQDTSWV